MRNNVRADAQEMVDGVRDRLSLEAAYEEMIEKDWQLAVNEDWGREQLVKSEALFSSYEASRHMPTLIEFLHAAASGSTVSGSADRRLLVEQDGWFRVVDRNGLTNCRTMLASEALEALQSGRIG